MIAENVAELLPPADKNPQPVKTNTEAPLESDQNVTTQEPVVQQPTNVKCTRTRIIKRPERLIEVAYSSYYEVLHEDDYKLCSIRSHFYHIIVSGYDVLS